MDLYNLYLEQIRIERELNNLNLFNSHREKALKRELKRINSLIKKGEKWFIF